MKGSSSSRTALVPGGKTRSLVGLFLGLALLLTGVGCGTGSEAESPPEDQPADEAPPESSGPVPVEVTALVRRTVEDLLTLDGDLRTDRIVDVTSQASGIVAETPIREGEPVTDETVLLRLEDEELGLAEQEAKFAWQEAQERSGSTEIEVREAAQQVRLKELAYAKAKREYEDLIKVVGPVVNGEPTGKIASGAFTREEIANRRFAMEQTAEELEGAKLALERSQHAERLGKTQAEIKKKAWERAALELSRATIIAPIEGYVSAFDLQKGELVTEGAVVATIIDPHPLHVDLRVPQRQLPLLRVGASVRVRPETHPGEVFAGRIDTIAPVVDAAQGTVKVRVAVDDLNERLRPGIYVSATIVFDVRENAALVPKEARLFEGRTSIVYVVRDDRAVRVALDVISQQAEHLEVRVGADSKLRPDDRIVVRGHTQLRPDVAVEVIPSGGNGRAAPAKASEPQSEPEAPVSETTTAQRER